MVAVRPDWTDGRGLLGYLNPLTKTYLREPALNLLLRAQRESEMANSEGRDPHPFFVILDEMNLAHVEQYFSDFLSCLESKKPLELFAESELELEETQSEMPVPPRFKIPSNVFFTGTVNVDETTYMFSPKVLDRAFTLELHRVDLESYGIKQEPGAIDGETLSLERLPLLEPLAPPSTEDWIDFGRLLDGELQRVIIELNELLTPDGLHFGYRVANEIAKFVLLASEFGTPGGLWAALDLAILEKVLPKFHGTQEELDAPLRVLFVFAKAAEPAELETWKEISDAWKLLNDRLQPTKGAPTKFKLPRTAAKVFTMLKRLHQQGFTSFIG